MPTFNNYDNKSEIQIKKNIEKCYAYWPTFSFANQQKLKALRTYWLKSWTKFTEGVPVVLWLDCALDVRKFELQLRYYIHFRTNIIRKVWTHLSFQLWVR